MQKGQRSGDIRNTLGRPISDISPNQSLNAMPASKRETLFRPLSSEQSSTQATSGGDQSSSSRDKPAREKKPVHKSYKYQDFDGNTHELTSTQALQPDVTKNRDTTLLEIKARELPKNGLLKYTDSHSNVYNLTHKQALRLSRISADRRDEAVQIIVAPENQRWEYTDSHSNVYNLTRKQALELSEIPPDRRDKAVSIIIEMEKLGQEIAREEANEEKLHNDFLEVKSKLELESKKKKERNPDTAIPVSYDSILQHKDITPEHIAVAKKRKKEDMKESKIYFREEHEEKMWEGINVFKAPSKSSTHPPKPPAQVTQEPDTLLTIHHHGEFAGYQPADLGKNPSTIIGDLIPGLGRNRENKSPRGRPPKKS